MKWILSLCLLLFLNLNSLATVNNELLRKLFHDIETEQDLDSILSYQGKLKNTIALSYFGSVIVMKAQYPISPLKKFHYFSEGKRLIEASIRENKNVENTYLRLLIQLNTPHFLGYYTDIENDIKFITKNIDASPLSNVWKVILLEKILLFESNDYDFSQLKLKLSKFRILCQNH